MIMGYHGSLSCHLGSFSRTHQNLHHHSLSSSSKSSLHSRYFHLWIWSLHVRVPQFWSLEELHVTAPQEPLQSWQAKNTSSWVISPFCQHVRIASGHQTRQWKKHSFHIFTIFHHTFPRSCYVLSMNGWLDFAEVLIRSPSSTSISTSNVPLRIFHVQRHILWYLVMFKIF